MGETPESEKRRADLAMAVKRRKQAGKKKEKANPSERHAAENWRQRKSRCYMRHFSPIVAVVAALGIALTACSNPRPPIGRWQGAYEDPNLIVVARLEIDSSGVVRISAPNAIVDSAPMSKKERGDLRKRLVAGLTQSWTSVGPLPLEFDGHIFHKPGGVAPQLEWDNAEKKMVLVFYSGNRASIHVPLDSVADFSSDS